MEEKVIYMDDVKNENNEKTIKEKAKDKVHCFMNFGLEHKEAILVLAPVFISGAVEVIKIIAKRGNLKAEQHLKDDYVYDSRSRHYYELNRRPRNSEWISIDERTSNGELLGKVLKDMGFID